MGPTVSIIAASFNAREHIEQMIVSVLNQTFRDFELIIIDGGSTDGTVDIIGKYAQSLAYWVSEPDKGIYDAMNKGIKAAGGQWLLFLGCDDRLFHNTTLERIAPSLRQDLNLIFGDILYDTGRTVHSRLGMLTLLHNTIHHQSAFYRRSLFANWAYDSSFKLISDYELNLMIYLRKMAYQHVDATIAVCSPHGQSRRSHQLAFQETNAIRAKHLPGILGKFCRLLYTIKFTLGKG